MATPNLRHSEFVEPVMQRIPEGWFSMGCDDGRDDERPVRRIWVDEFELAAYQTTNEDYARFLEATQHVKPLQWDDPNFNHPKQPVVAVSWFEAEVYCEWMTRESGRRYRLPTEAEWERAAQGVGSTWSPQGEKTAWLYPWGNSGVDGVPNYSERWKTGPEPVGLYAPNSFGLFNLGDNVHEWCSDWYDAAYYAVSPERNPQGPAAGTRRASRGGSWRHHIKITRTAARSSIPPELKYADYGFRMARSVDATI